MACARVARTFNNQYMERTLWLYLSTKHRIYSLYSQIHSSSGVEGGSGVGTCVSLLYTLACNPYFCVAATFLSTSRTLCLGSGAGGFDSTTRSGPQEGSGAGGFDSTTRSGPQEGSGAGGFDSTTKSGPQEGSGAGGFDSTTRSGPQEGNVYKYRCILWYKQGFI